MKNLFLFSVAFSLAGRLGAQDPAAYRIFDSTGDPTPYDDVIEALAGADVVFFGELHNNPVAHWLQLRVGQSLFDRRGENLIIGAEMFETDIQLLIDEYWQDLIPTKTFEDDSRMWKNYATDYKPLVEWARSQKLELVATNIPRRYANLVYRKGPEALDSLSQTACAYMMPLPVTIDYELPTYKAMTEMMAGHGGGDKLIAAQAVKDATMAHFIFKNWKPGKLFYHLNGSYHSENKEGIVWYLRRLNPNLKVATIATVEQDDLGGLTDDHAGKADYLIVIPGDMTKTY
jgi:uncharacterized iron-regulated protein